MALAADSPYEYAVFPSAIERLHDDARRLRRAILDARTEDEAERHRRALDEVEARIEDHESACGCQGFPPGK